jgi:uncharacterized protein (TIGR02246 family)
MKYALSLLTVLFIIACQPQQPVQEEPIDMDELKATLQAMEDAYAEAWNARDAEAIVAYYADDAVSMGAGEPPVSGKAAIMADIKEELMEVDEDAVISFQVVDVFADGDLAVEVGQTTMTQGGTSEVVGKYISVFEKRDGNWICIRDSYSDNSEDEEEEQAEEMGGEE